MQRGAWRDQNISGSQLLFSLNCDFHWGRGRQRKRLQDHEYPGRGKSDQHHRLWRAHQSKGVSASADANNRLTGTGATYDFAGNQLTSTDAFGTVHNYVYDAESRIVAVDAGDVSYTYDGDGQRVVKNLGTVTAEYIYFGGRRIARTDNPASTATAALKYYLTDHLGSTIAVTDETFNKVQDTDYYPYGREVILSGSIQNGADSNHYKFTGKKRDAETGLDYFGARYFGSNMGR